MQMMTQAAAMIGYMTNLGSLLKVLKTEYANSAPITPNAYGNQG